MMDAFCCIKEEASFSGCLKLIKLKFVALLLVAVFAACGAFTHIFVALYAQLVMGNFLVDVDLLGGTLVTLGTAQLHVSLVGEGDLAKRAAFVLIAVSSICSARESNQSKQSNNSLFHRNYLLWCVKELRNLTIVSAKVSSI